MEKKDRSVRKRGRLGRDEFLHRAYCISGFIDSLQEFANGAWTNDIHITRDIFSILDNNFTIADIEKDFYDIADPKLDKKDVSLLLWRKSELPFALIQVLKNEKTAKLKSIEIGLSLVIPLYFSTDSIKKACDKIHDLQTDKPHLLFDNDVKNNLDLAYQACIETEFQDSKKITYFLTLNLYFIAIYTSNFLNEGEIQNMEEEVPDNNPEFHRAGITYHGSFGIKDLNDMNHLLFEMATLFFFRTIFPILFDTIKYCCRCNKYYFREQDLYDWIVDYFVGADSEVEPNNYRRYISLYHYDYVPPKLTTPNTVREFNNRSRRLEALFTPKVSKEIVVTFSEKVSSEFYKQRKLYRGTHRIIESRIVQLQNIINSSFLGDEITILNNILFCLVYEIHQD